MLAEESSSELPPEQAVLAPALAAAAIGVTYASATDVATEAADITILHDDLLRLPHMVTLARRSVRIIKQNLFWAFFYNVAAIPGRT